MYALITAPLLTNIPCHLGFNRSKLKRTYHTRLLILSIALVSGQVLFGQQTREIKGRVVMDGEVLIGQSIVEEGTLNGTFTQLDGKFQLTIPSDKPVLLYFSQCFTPGYLLITPDMEYVEINMNRKFFRRSKRAYRKWKRSKSNLKVAEKKL